MASEEAAEELKEALEEAIEEAAEEAKKEAKEEAKEGEAAASRNSFDALTCRREKKICQAWRRVCSACASRTSQMEEKTETQWHEAVSKHIVHCATGSDYLMLLGACTQRRTASTTGREPAPL